MLIDFFHLSQAADSEPVRVSSSLDLEVVDEDNPTFYIEQLEDGSWRVMYSFLGDTDIFIDNIYYFSSVAMMIAEALRRLETAGETCDVHDPSGRWDYWVNHTKHGVPRAGIPTHTVYR